ncbi:MAG TPA: cyclic nucleotide-binding domain-containing protein [Alphaproteobacteria bacterium]|nr:cyclic nucleotide-binding domain-containing protein [Alphaproteobacteria bacterium]HNS44387.1 cyclic nucleotide-binding domain-containing protein [Alphaproteobacteria bacterium]
MQFQVNTSEGPLVFERQFVPKGKLVIRQGDKGSEAYLIQSGEVTVYSEADGKRTVLGALGAGEIFGEMALFNEGRRAASVEVDEDCSLIVITRKILEEKIKRSDPTIQAIVRMAIRRLDEKNKNISGHTH